jgi:ABC-type branched-subunit amino acid transport system substrate-binding protein
VLALVPAIPPAQLTGEGADFVAAFTDQHGRPQAYTAYAAEAAGVLLDAIARSDGTRASVLQQVRRAGPREGLLGRYRFDAAGDATLRRYAVLVVDDGRFRFDRVVDVSEPNQR